jgi:hypothetical protein
VTLAVRTAERHDAPTIAAPRRRLVPPSLMVRLVAPVDSLDN